MNTTINTQTAGSARNPQLAANSVSRRIEAVGGFRQIRWFHAVEWETAEVTERTGRNCHWRLGVLGGLGG
jgi:hypothetical protein